VIVDDYRIFCSIALTLINTIYNYPRSDRFCLLTLVDDESLGVQRERKNKSACLNQNNFGT